MRTKLPACFLLVLTLTVALCHARVEPNFQLTGSRRPATSAGGVSVALVLPLDDTRYEVIGLMNDCSAFSEYEEFISAYKATAAAYGANCIVVQKSGLCVHATAIYLLPAATTPSQQPTEDCGKYLKQIVRLHQVVDSLQTVIAKLSSQ